MTAGALFPSGFPSLPAADPEPERRRARLAADQATYELDYSYHDLPFARHYDDLPASDRVLPRYSAKRTALLGALGANMAAQKVADVLEAPAGEDRVLHAARKIFELMGKQLDDQPSFGRYNELDPTRVVTRTRQPHRFADYIHQFRLIMPPDLHVAWDGTDPPGLTDRFFAAQRVAGTNPVLLERVEGRLPERFGVGDEHLARALSAQGVAPMTLAEAIGEGRLYLVDMAILDGLPTTQPQGKELRQFLWAPLSLYLSVPSERYPQAPLLPVAIQLGQEPGWPIHTPVDPRADPRAALRWRMAKLAVQSCDSNHHGIVMHNAECHLMLGRVVIGTRRALAPNHPVRVLLEPHFEGTLKVVNEGTRDLVEPGGFTPLLQSVNLEGVFELLHRSFREHDWMTWDPRQTYRRRGVDDERLEYPYRDDELRLHRILRSFVERYLRLYYHEDEAVASDVELAAWVAELEGPCRIRNIVPGGEAIGRVDGLVDLVTSIISRATLLHAAINYSVFDYMSFAPNMPGAIYGPGPDAIEGEVTEEDLLRMLPPLDQTNLQIGDTFFVQNMLLDTLGHYRPQAFADPRVHVLVRDLKRELADAELLIGRQNATRSAPFEILFPSRIAQSILV